MTPRVFIGYDARERLAWQVCCASLQARARTPVEVAAIGREQLVGAGLYTRPQAERNGLQWDLISNAPCSTDFAIARFWTPLLAGRAGWAIFCDGDFLWRADVHKLFELADPRYAVMVVPHVYSPPEVSKMDGQVQTRYRRKGQSSLMMLNLAHAGTQRMTPHMLNTWPGRDLHAFGWLKDSEIGALPEAWNWLEGHSPMSIEPAAVHFTRGTPDMSGWEFTSYAEEWNAYASAFSRRVA